MRVLQPRRVMRQSARRLDFRLHVRDHPLNRLKLREIFPERFALLRVLDRFLQRALRQSHGLRGNADAPAVQRAQRNFQPLPFFAQPVLSRHHAIIQ